MPMAMDMLAVVSICPPSMRPHSADNVIEISTSLWGLWERIDEWLLNAEGEFDENDIWILSWEVYWDLDEVIEEFSSGYIDENGVEETIEYTVWDILESAQEMVGQDRQWLGDPDPRMHTQENVNQMALHITAMITGLPIVAMNQDVFNPELTSFVKWRSRLYGGVWRKEA